MRCLMFHMGTSFIHLFTYFVFLIIIYDWHLPRLRYWTSPVIHVYLLICTRIHTAPKHVLVGKRLKVPKNSSIGTDGDDWDIYRHETTPIFFLPFPFSFHPILASAIYRSVRKRWKMSKGWKQARGIVKEDTTALSFFSLPFPSHDSDKCT